MFDQYEIHEIFGIPATDILTALYLLNNRFSAGTFLEKVNKLAGLADQQGKDAATATDLRVELEKHRNDSLRKDGIIKSQEAALMHWRHEADRDTGKIQRLEKELLIACERPAAEPVKLSINAALKQVNSFLAEGGKLNVITEYPAMPSRSVDGIYTPFTPQNTYVVIKHDPEVSACS